MITVHHLNHSRSHKILWLLEELNLPYTIVFYQRDPITMRAPDTLQAIHPLGGAPVIEDAGLVLAESGAIISYLLARYDPEHRLWPEGDHQIFPEYLYWLHYTEGSLMPLLTQKLIFARLGKAPVLWALRGLGGIIANGMQKQYIDPQIIRQRDHIQQQLSDSLWLLGDHLCGADIQLSSALEVLWVRGLNREAGPIKEYIDRIHARQAYQKALEKGGAFEVLV